VGTAALAAALGEGLGAERSVAVLPNLGRNAVAAEFAGKRWPGSGQQPYTVFHNGSS
jgi:hypothetical protein